MKREADFLLDLPLVIIRYHHKKLYLFRRIFVEFTGYDSGVRIDANPFGDFIPF
jgi:hypothetical protein